MKTFFVIAGTILVLVFLILMAAPTPGRRTTESASNSADSFIGKEVASDGLVTGSGRATMSGLPYVEIVNERGTKIKCYEPISASLRQGTKVAFVGTVTVAERELIILRPCKARPE